MSIEITVVRHGETTANQAGVWQGWSNAGFSARGREQVKRLADRLSDDTFDLVVSSDLGRAMATAGALGRDVESDSRWRELNLGVWEGTSRGETGMNDPEFVESLRRGDDPSFGGGERMSELLGRVQDGFDALVGRLDDGQRALVVSHGGAIFALMSSVLGVDLHRRLARLTNTSLTTITVADGFRQLATFNDATHLPDAPVRADADATHLMLVRHGETEANVQHRWQGQQPGNLTDRGREQAVRLGEHMDGFDVLYTSPLRRAVDTAQIVGRRIGLVPEPVEDLKEIGFGSWENLTFEEIQERDPAGLAAVMNGSDIARGGSGETLEGVARRMSAALGSLAERHEGERIGVVSHGGALRAYATALLGIPFAERRRLPVIENTAMAHVVYGDHGPTIATWNVAPHLRA